MLMIHPASRLARDAGAALLPPALFAYGGCDDGATASMAVTITAAGGTLDGPSGTQLVVPAGAVTHPTSVTVAHSGADVGAVFPLTPHGTAFAAIVNGPAVASWPPSAAAAIGAGSDHSLTVDPNGNVWAWGRNVLHQLGDGTNTQRNAPAQVPGINLH